MLDAELLHERIRPLRAVEYKALAELGFAKPRRVTTLRRDEFDALVEQGHFIDEPIELLRGVLVEMSPQGDPHNRIAAWFAQRFSKVLDFDDFDIRGHSPYAATDDSEPEPDVSVSRRSKYAGHPDRALLLIEVSGSSLRKDRTIKTEIYAEAAVPEYWIVDIKKHRIDVLTHPTAHGYSRTKQLVVGDTLRPMRMPGIAIELASIPWVLPERPKRRKRR